MTDENWVFEKTKKEAGRPDRPLRTVGKNVVIVQEMSEEVSAGGIHIPDTQRHKVPHGKVVVVGPDVTSVTEGTHVYFGGAGGQLVTVDGCAIVYTVIHEDDILLY